MTQDETGPVRVWITANGGLRAASRDAADRRMGELASFVESDIQSSRRFLSKLFSGIEDIQAGRCLNWEITGNAYRLTLRRAGVTLEHVIYPDDLPHSFTFTELRSALAAVAEVLVKNEGR